MHHFFVKLTLFLSSIALTRGKLSALVGMRRLKQGFYMQVFTTALVIGFYILQVDFRFLNQFKQAPVIYKMGGSTMLFLTSDFNQTVHTCGFHRNHRDSANFKYTSKHRDATCCILADGEEHHFRNFT